MQRPLLRIERAAGAADDGDAASSPELKQAFIAEDSERAEDGVSVDSEVALQERLPDWGFGGDDRCPSMRTRQLLPEQQTRLLKQRRAGTKIARQAQQERADKQQERIDLAARELAEVSERLQAAANALRASI